MSREMMEVMYDIRDRVVRMETQLEVHVESHAKLTEQVQKHDKEITKAKASVKILKAVLLFLFVTAPAAVLAAMRIFKGSP